ncbi:MAG: SDR family NAD(P)-dependent oxidoreductase [Gemmatimonadota bacterium]|jgi:NADP-dependent 3-hydroxy acid dehydrogenase YdfG
MSEGRVVVITGASAGIGASTSELLSSSGMRVVLTARRGELLDEVAGRCEGPTLTVPADSSVREEVKGVVDAALAEFGQIDVWVNNAGRGITRAPSELTAEDVATIMDANVMTALYGMQEVLPHFKSRGTGQVVNVSSFLGRIPFATQRSAYVGAKHFLNAITATFRAEVQETHPDICVSLVSPGVVYTDFGLVALHGGVDSRERPNGQTAEEVAHVIAEVIENRRADVYTRPGTHERVVEYYDSIGSDP